MRILGIDPGGGTGWVLAQPGPTVEHTIFATGTFRGEHHQRLLNWLTELQPDVIVYEKFVHVGSKKGVDYQAPEYIGIIKLYGETNEQCLLVPQLPLIQGDSSFWTDDKLRILGLWKPGKDHKDEMSAIKHLLHHLTQDRKEKLYLYELKRMGSFDA